MKKKFLYTTVICSLFLATTQSCQFKDNQDSSQQEQADTISVHSKFTDQVGKNKLTCMFNGVLPNTTNKSLFINIHEWINECLGGSFMVKDSLNLNTTLDYYNKEWSDESIKQIKEYASEDDKIEYVYDCSFDINAITDKYISVSINKYRYEGGAHGSTIVEQQTFRKHDGRAFTWNNMIKQGSMNEVNELIKKYLMKYFEVETEEALKDLLFDPDNTILMPLPQTNPILTSDGLHFIYQQYEICAYAAGMPSGVIPYDEIKPYLTTSALGLLGE